MVHELHLGGWLNGEVANTIGVLTLLVAGRGAASVSPLVIEAPNATARQERITEPITPEDSQGEPQRTGREAWKAAALPTELLPLDFAGFVLSQSAWPTSLPSAILPQRPEDYR